MFGRKADQYVEDEVLGTLHRRRGQWRGSIRLTSDDIPLALPGGRAGPDEAAIELARSASDEFERARAAIASELAEHRLVYDADGPHDSDLEPRFVQIVEFERRLTVEFGYQTPWDEEHTLGARVRGGELVELCGSIVQQ